MANAEQRTVTTDALATLGTIIGEFEKRDAIHLAVEPTTAAEILRPGQDVGVDGTSRLPHVGIVDPFLKKPVMTGERFWLIVYPRQINSLRHVWTHPAFRDELQSLKTNLNREASEQWLRNFIASADVPDYETVMFMVRHYADEDRLVFGEDASGEIPPEFWEHAEVVLGRKIHNRAEWFSCAC